jgi:hypothetical protein
MRTIHYIPNNTKAPPMWRSFVVNARVIAAILPASERQSVALEAGCDVPPIEAEENDEDGWEGSPSHTTIRRGRLCRLPGVRRRAIDLIIYEGSLLSEESGNAHLGGGFALRCVQRFSRLDVATRRWVRPPNRYTSGPAAPVLSY